MQSNTSPASCQILTRVHVIFGPLRFQQYVPKHAAIKTTPEKVLEFGSPRTSPRIEAGVGASSSPLASVQVQLRGLFRPCTSSYPEDRKPLRHGPLHTLSARSCCVILKLNHASHLSFLNAVPKNEVPYVDARVSNDGGTFAGAGIGAL